MPVIAHGDCANFSPLVAATSLYNVVDSPVGIIPVTRVDPTKDKVTEEWSTGPGLGSYIYEKALYNAKKPIYDPEGMNGIPVGVQVVGRKWEDEKVIGKFPLGRIFKSTCPTTFFPLYSNDARGRQSVGTERFRTWSLGRQK